MVLTFDDNYLEENGLGSMPQAARRPFIHFLHGQLELRVGAKLSEGLSNEQVDEYVKLIDGVAESVEAFLKQIPDYQNHSDYLKVQEQMQLPTDHPELNKEFAPQAWLSIHRPNFREIVNTVFTDLAAEVKSSSQKILASLE